MADQGHARARRLGLGWVLVLSAAAWAIPLPQSSANPASQTGSAAAPASNTGSPAAKSPPEQVADAPLPDSPGTMYSQNLMQDQTAGGQQTTPTQKQQGTVQEPAGTAAARTANPAGVAASEPAGSAIAPAKQRRVRTILISVGALLGAGAALGAVAALSAGSPSRPPGAH